MVARSFWALAMGAWLWTAGASADVAACVAAADRGQVERDERQLAAARASFVACSDAACPDAVRRECVNWLADVEARLPSLVVVVRDGEGRDVKGASVWLDAQPLGTDALGRELSVDPGPHRLRAALGERESELEVVASERERGRLVALVLSGAAPEAALPPAMIEPRGRPWLGPLLTVSGGALLAGAAGLVTLDVRGDAHELRERCAPACDAGDVDPLTRRIHLADGLFYVGVAAVAAGVVWWAWPRDRARTVRVGLTPTGLRAAGTF